MKTLASVANNVNEDYQLEELTLGDLKEDKVLVRVVATGVCISDESTRKGRAPFPLPLF